MAVTVLLKVRAKPGRSDDVVKFFAGILDDTRAREGCIEIRPVRNLDDQDDIWVVEQWRSRADHESYMGWRVEIGTFADSLQYLEGNPEIHYYEELDA